MIDFPTSGLQSVTHTRTFLNKIERLFRNSTAAGKTAATAQILHMCTTSYSGKRDDLYPNTVEGVAHSVRTELAHLARYIARQSGTARISIAAQIKAMTDELGIVVPAIVGAADGSVNAIGPFPEDSVQVFSVPVDSPTGILPVNYLTTNWTVNGADVGGQDGDILTLTMKEPMTQVQATTVGVAGTATITWDFTVTPAPLFVDQSGLNGSRVQVLVPDEVTKQELNSISKADLVKVLNGEITLTAALT